MSWQQTLRDGGRLLLDGGTGSELRRRGIELSGICWSAGASLDHSACLTEIHRDYIRAGADIVTANTFAAARFVLEAAGLGEHRDAIVAAAIGAARCAAAEAEIEAATATAAARKIAVAASVSCLAPGFDRSAYPPRDAEYRAYAGLAEACAAHGADLLVLEMMQDPAHTELACRAAAAVGLPYWIGISCRLSPDTASGRTPPALVGFDDAALEFDRILEAALRYTPAVMAVMHTPLDAMLPALDRLGAAWPGPVAAYAELPYPEDPAATVSRRVTADEYAAAASGWLAHGAAIIGGCCGTTPDHIAALRPLLDG